MDQHTHIKSLICSTYACSCYVRNDYTPSVDECSTIADCMDGATCINSPDGFVCLCPPGFTGDGRTSGNSCAGKTLAIHLALYQPS